MKNQESFDYIAKVILVGETNVGKTNILTRYCKDEFKSNNTATVGQEKFRAITNSFYLNSSVALVVFDLSKYSSYEKINHWISELKQHAGNECEIIIVGNKSDLKEIRAITYDEAKKNCDNYGYKLM